MLSMKSQLQTIHGDLKNELKSEIMSSIQALLHTYINGAKENSPQMMVTPRSELGSNSVHRPSNLVQNLENMFTGPSPPLPIPTPSDKPLVILLMLGLFGNVAFGLFLLMLELFGNVAFGLFG